MSEQKPLVLLHGALGSKDQFDTLKKELSNSFNVYTLNFEGHGGRESKREFSMKNFMENLLELMQVEKLESANFFGFSMGGYVALKLAMEHPGKVEKIMTLGTKFGWSEEAAHEEVSLLNPLKLEEKVPEYADDLKKRHAPLDWHEVLSKTGEMMLSLGKGQAEHIEDFKKVQCPVLITRGTKDRMVSEEESKEVANTIPNADFYSFEEFKHPLEQVDVARLSEKVRAFFNA